MIFIHPSFSTTKKERKKERNVLVGDMHENWNEFFSDLFAVHRPACVSRRYREYRSHGATARRAATSKAAFIVAERVTRPFDTLALLDLGEREREDARLPTISIVRLVSPHRPRYAINSRNLQILGQTFPTPIRRSASRLEFMHRFHRVPRA